MANGENLTTYNWIKKSKSSLPIKIEINNVKRNYFKNYIFLALCIWNATRTDLIKKLRRVFEETDYEEEVIRDELLTDNQLDHLQLHIFKKKLPSTVKTLIL